MEPQVDSAAERMRILEMIEAGRITAAEGLQLLAGLAAGAPAGGEAQAAPAAAATATAAPPDFDRWRRWWLVPLWAGVGVLLLGALLMFWAISTAGVGLLLACAAVPFGLGVLLMALAAASRSARWMHIRVDTGQNAWPRSIRLSFPLPIRLTAWALRTFGHRIPGLADHGVDELVMAVAESSTPEAPLYVDVHEGDGEHVQVYIG